MSLRGAFRDHTAARLSDLVRELGGQPQQSRMPPQPRQQAVVVPRVIRQPDSGETVEIAEAA